MGGGEGLHSSGYTRFLSTPAGGVAVEGKTWCRNCDLQARIIIIMFLIIIIIMFLLLIIIIIKPTASEERRIYCLETGFHIFRGSELHHIRIHWDVYEIQMLHVVD